MMARRKIVKRKKGRQKSKSSKFSKAIQSLRHMKSSQRVSAIRHANDKFIRDFVSHVRKLRAKKLPPKFQKVLKHHKAKLRFISNPKVSLGRKRKTLSQKGGFLPALLPLLAPVVGSVLGGIFGRK